MREDKEKKRAEALRANLRRRKVAQKGKAVEAAKAQGEKKGEKEE